MSLSAGGRGGQRRDPSAGLTCDPLLLHGSDPLLHSTTSIAEACDGDASRAAQPGRRQIALSTEGGKATKRSLRWGAPGTIMLSAAAVVLPAQAHIARTAQQRADDEQQRADSGRAQRVQL